MRKFKKYYKKYTANKPVIKKPKIVYTLDDIIFKNCDELERYKKLKEHTHFLEVINETTVRCVCNKEVKVDKSYCAYNLDSHSKKQRPSELPRCHPRLPPVDKQKRHTSTTAKYILNSYFDVEFIKMLKNQNLRKLYQASANSDEAEIWLQLAEFGRNRAFSTNKTFKKLACLMVQIKELEIAI
ncbi:hypothetical protein C1646_751591 [Rhizophagus diaphanus]|nr:hypothetical protein C1646_751591 [Rhizophagus diaphanus] [Rhizophagus sp. MUCL 43196]